MPSNEAIELIESVLSSVNESERAYYRIHDIYKKKIDDLNNQIKNEKKKVEYYGKDPNKLHKLESEKEKFENDIEYYGSGFKDLSIDEVKKGDRRLKDRNKGRDYTENSIRSKGWYIDLLRPGVENKELSDKEERMHERIDKRTKAFDTTAKHEAACILIEALDTLLSE